MLGSMAEQSLLCVNCGAAPPPHRRTWSRCTVCIERNLPSTYYCGEECMNAHWPKHKVYHKEQKELAKQLREGGQTELDRSVVEAEARRAERTGDEFDHRVAAAMKLSAEGNHHAAAKAWRKLIKERPERPSPYHNLAVLLERAGRLVEAAPIHLKTMELCENGTVAWADAAACAFDLLKLDDCRDVPKPEWWNDEGLKALSARVVAVEPDTPNTCAMRGLVLSACRDGGVQWVSPPWNVGPRTAAEIKEAATWYRRASKLALTPADRQKHEKSASRCDAVADPLLAEEEAEAAKARAAAKAEAAEALKVAEAKAAAAAEELLAEEEKEKQQQAASTKGGKAKQGKGKKGKGKR